MKRRHFESARELGRTTIERIGPYREGDEVRFARDSLVEGAGFEPSVPGERAGGLLSKPGKLSDALRPQRWVTQVGRSSFRQAPVTSLSTFDAELARV
jgi:hypothetical protein